MEIETLKWDSGFFGIKIGKTILDSRFNSDEFTALAKENNFDLVYLFRETKSLSVDEVAQKNISLVDIMITMSLELNITSDPGPFDFNTSLNKKEIDECYEIAEDIAKVSRFYKEPLIGKEKAMKLYRKWIDNSLNGSFCDGILLNRSEGHIRGIHSVKTDLINGIGICSLIGTHPLHRGFGIGRNLWQQAFSYWSTQKNVTRCRVLFSLENMESFNFHLKMGFNKVESVRFIYHYRKE